MKYEIYEVTYFNQKTQQNVRFYVEGKSNMDAIKFFTKIFNTFAADFIFIKENIICCIKVSEQNPNIDHVYRRKEINSMMIFLKLKKYFPRMLVNSIEEPEVIRKRR